MEKIGKKISDKVLGKIKEENVKPIPKWHFVLKHGLLWVLLIILLIIGAIALGITIFELSDVEWGLRATLGFSVAGLFIRVFPYFWAVILILIVILAYYNFINTPKGYRYPKYQIVLFGILLIILTATAFHYAGIAKNTRNFLHNQAPVLDRLMHNKDMLYNMPDKGLLAGKIIEINDENIVVKTFDMRDWLVDIKDAHIPINKKIEEGQKVKILGEVTGENEFKANELKPWQMGDKLRLNDKPSGEKMGPKNGLGGHGLNY